ncbi:hypothetical protein ACSS6W_002900 [Trichoderma asperelloides]
MAQAQQLALERLEYITKGLRSRANDDVRKRSAIQLRELVVVCHRDLSPEQFLSFYNNVNNKITQLITHGSDSAERLGGIYALDSLVDFEGVDVAAKYTRFTQNLKTILRGKDTMPMRHAAIALGKLCRPGGAMISELVDSEVNTALEWLQNDRVEERRYSAVLVLRELARNAPTLMYQYIPTIFDWIWVGLRDPRQLIRETSAETVSACFRIIRERDQEMKQIWMSKIYNEARQGLKVNTVESIHASLLVLKELLEQGGMYMQDHYQEACDIVFKHKDHRDPTTRKTVVLLIPDLASYSPADFAHTWLHKFMVYLSGMLKKDKERNDAFLAIGNIANSVKSAIAPYLDGVLIYVREGLSVQSRKRGSVDPVFDCISRLAVAVGQTLSKYMEALLDPIFACDLTPKLTQALVDMAFYIPPVKPIIQERLLDMLSVVLCGEPFKPLGAPQPNTLTSVPTIVKDAKDPQAYENRKTEIKLALNTLGSFDFSGHVLNEFVRDVAIKYVEDEDPEIREAAALTCCQLYVRDPIVNQTSYHALQVVGDVIEKLLTVGISDPEPNIRRTVLAALDERFDRHLAKAENIHQSSNIKREAALHSLGQLASNSGYVITPYLEYPQLLEILQAIIRTEDQRGPLRQETIKLMGILGALDPYKHQQVEEKTPEMQRRSESNQLTDISLMMTGLTPSNKEYFPTVVINALLQILKDHSLAQHHAAVIEAIMNIFRTLGLECVSFLDRIVPAFLLVIRSSPPTRLESYFNQLATLVSIVRQHIRNYLPEIVEILQEYWNKSSSLQTTILYLVEAISRSLEGEFKIYLASLLPLMLGVLDKDASPKRTPSEKVLHAFLVFGASAEEYMHLIIPVIVRTFEKQGHPTFLRKQAIDTIGKISRQVNLNDFAAKIIHPLTRVLDTGEPQLRLAALDTLCALVQQLGRDYIHFMGTVNKVINQHQIQHQNYDLLVSKLQKGEVLPQDLTSDAQLLDIGDETPFADLNNKKLEMNAIHLKAAWDTKGKSTKEDWQEWLRRFSTTLLTESPNHALRACASLASVYLPLARELFNSAFVSCWSELYEQFQDELIQNIESAIKSENVPPDLLGLLLNLAEFMEHDDKALPIDIRVLGREAARCHAYAKALHYKELEFLQDQSSGAVEALIVINNQLQQSDAAIGILRKAQLYKEGIQLRETWFEKLERWEEALSSYNKREKEVPADQPIPIDIVMGKMRCLHALGEWDALASLTGSTWANSAPEVQRMIAPLATAAAWGLGKWDSMDNYLSSLKRYSPDRSFFGAILALHRNQFREAIACIEQAREGLDTELSALVSESYNRAYQVVVRVQMLAELEELIVYKQCDEKKQATMRKTWETRLEGCQRNVEVWQRMLRLRALVIAPSENIRMWIKFANLCRKSGRMGLAEKSLKQLIGSDAPLEALIPYWSDDKVIEKQQQGQAPRTPPAAQVIYGMLKYQWELGQQPSMKASGIAERTLYCLQRFTNDSAHRLDLAKAHLTAQTGSDVNLSLEYGFQNQIDPSVMSPQTQRALVDQTVLLAKCYLRQGEWQIALNKDDWQNTKIQDILASYSQATKYNPRWYKAWHAWALANFEIVQTLTARNEGQMSRADQTMIIEHVVPAIQGFFKSIALSAGSSLQDTLRLLTLWFTHGGNSDVNTAVTEGFANVSIDTWLEVIPQLIARINQPNKRVQQSVHNLLADVGRAHPQALVYPLTVAMKSWQNSRRSRSAAQIMDSMRQHSANLVAQADTVSHELIRVAVLWHELWHEGLEEASRLYFGDHNIEGMFAALEPLHEQLERGPETLREISFAQAFGRDLKEAQDWCHQYETSRDVNDLNQAWDLYYQVFRRITRQLPQVTSLELTYCSPKLLNAKNLDLAVPGTYKSGQPIVRIMSFDSTFTVINSKQRPRKLNVNGSDGISYAFLLKGHEDIRQDERVMQLFGLCNTLLANDSEYRHPSNLMLDRVTGKIIHIDFGDCFEVATKREKYPERVPFRLTRMLTYAMEVSNIEGSFRITCEHVMRVLRDNKESVMAVLEAFIHDPLLTWRLTNAASPAGPFRSEREAALAGPHAMRARRQSILDADVAPSELMANVESSAPPTRHRARTNSSAFPDGIQPNGTEERESQNARAIEVLDRVSQKLTGRDFKPNEELDVINQVNKLIIEATKLENLCQHYIGWCSFW